MDSPHTGSAGERGHIDQPAAVVNLAVIQRAWVWVSMLPFPALRLCETAGDEPNKPLHSIAPQQKFQNRPFFHVRFVGPRKSSDCCFQRLYAVLQLRRIHFCEVAFRLDQLRVGILRQQLNAVLSSQNRSQPLELHGGYPFHFPVHKNEHAFQPRRVIFLQLEIYKLHPSLIWQPIPCPQRKQKEQNALVKKSASGLSVYCRVKFHRVVRLQERL